MSPEEIVAGKFRVDHLLGAGGMGKVFAATHLQLEQPVALKIMSRAVMEQSPAAVQRFLREARAVARLRSRHVGRVLDVGTLHSGAPYIVMEYLEGSNLASLLKVCKKLAVAVAVDYVLQASEALAEAHALKIVHRDIKPANLFLTEEADGSPLIKLLDFGIAKASPGDPGSDLTRTMAVLGSPAYTPPEQVRSSKDVDGRSDIWSLGAVLYELVSGRRYSDGSSSYEDDAEESEASIPPHEIPGLPEGFASVLARALQPEPEARFDNVAEMAAALAPFGGPGSDQAALRIARVLGRPVARKPIAPEVTDAETEVDELSATTLRSAVGVVVPSASEGRGRTLRIGGIVLGAAAAVAIAAAAAVDGGDGAALPSSSRPSAAEGAEAARRSLSDPPQEAPEPLVAPLPPDESLMEVSPDQAPASQREEERLAQEGAAPDEARSDPKGVKEDARAEAGPPGGDAGIESSKSRTSGAKRGRAGKRKGRTRSRSTSHRDVWDRRH